MAGGSAVLATCHDGTMRAIIWLAGHGNPYRCQKPKKQAISGKYAAGITVLNGKVPVGMLRAVAVAGIEVADIDEKGW